MVEERARMPMSQAQAQSLCSEIEWKTVANSFPPKLSELRPPLAKKNANRIARFLSKAESEGDRNRANALREALERVRALVPDKAVDKRQSERRQKKKEARGRSLEQKRHRAQVREKLRQRAEEPVDPDSEEKAAAEKKEESSRKWYETEKK